MGYQLGELDPAAHQLIDEPSRVEAAEHVQVPAGEQGIAQVGQARDVEQRQRGQMPGPGTASGTSSFMNTAAVMSCSWVSGTSLGLPVVPLVCTKTAGADGRSRSAGQSGGTRPVPSAAVPRRSGRRERVVQVGARLPGQAGAVAVGDDGGRPRQPQ